MTGKQQKIQARCSRVMFGAMCGLIFFLPISAALVEWMFAIGFISYIIKRSIDFQAGKPEGESKRSTFIQKSIFFIRFFKPKDNVLNQPIAAYLVIVFLSAITSYDPILSIEAFFTKTLQGILTVFIMLEAITNRKQVKVFISVFLFSFTLVSWNAFMQYMFGDGFLRGRIITEGRLLSSFRFANDYAAYLVVCVPLLFSLSFLKSFQFKFSRQTTFEEEQDDFFKTPFFMRFVLVLFMVAVMCLGLTYSRAGWGAAVLGMFLLVRHQKKMMAGLLAATLIFALFFVPKMVKERTTNIGGDYSRILTLSSRNVTWRNAGIMIQDHPALGVGLNNYTRIARMYKFIRSEYPHNCYLQMAAEIGILGLGFFGWIMFAFFKGAFRQLQDIHDVLFYYIQLGALGGAAGFLIHSFFDTFFYSTQLSALLWVMVGLVLANGRLFQAE